MIMLAAALLLPAACRARSDAGHGEVAVEAPRAPDAGENHVEPNVEVESLRDAVPAGDVGESPENADVPPAESGVPGELAVPRENREPDARPGPASAETLGRKLLEAIVADDASVSTEAMFPPAPFEILKDLPVPSAYHRRLVGWFEEDLHTKHGELGGATDLVFERFRFGRCTWQEPHSEGNLLPYWSCRRNRIVALRGTRVVEIEVRVIIHWGAEWFVVHLGPVRQ